MRIHHTRSFIAFAVAAVLCLSHASAQAPIPEDEALVKALLGPWCRSNDGGRTCYAFDEFKPNGILKSCGTSQRTGLTYAAEGTYRISSRTTCVTVTYASKRFAAKPGHHFCTETLSIDGSSQRYRNHELRRESVLYRIPTEKHKCPEVDE